MMDVRMHVEGLEIVRWDVQCCEFKHGTMHKNTMVGSQMCHQFQITF